MTRRSLPSIPVKALRSHAEPARVERVWRRLVELDVVGARPRRVSLRWWSPAAAFGIFAAGVLVGVRVTAPQAELAAVAEPQRAVAPPGAGPVAEREVAAAEPKDAPAPKRPRALRAPTAGSLVVEEYPTVYAEPERPLSSEPSPLVAGPAEWERLAETGDFRAAKEALGRSGGFDSALVRASAGQLMVLADIARAGGSRDQATQALKRVLTAYVSAPEAPVAAWTLGNLLEQAGDRAGAAEAYATYRRLSPTGDFAEDAAARQVDVALSQGNLELAGRAMDEYAQNFPTGRRLVELRNRLAALMAPARDRDAAAPSPEPDEDEEANEPSGDSPVVAPAAAREH